jgi:NAD(P)-dependent dehydrogenase (short-subunit alcohol dehydrogenase family)
MTATPSARARLAGKVVLVTGAAQGIGLACARAMHAEGAIVYLSDINAVAVAREAEALGEPARSLTLDVREESDWERACATVVAACGRLDVLVNNAGITGFESAASPPPPHDPEHASLADWRAVFATNGDGVFLGCRAALRTMRARPPRGGSIVNMSSRSGLVGIPRAAAYAASKAAVRNHTKSVALYAAEEGLGVRCNSVHPAAVLTPMWEPMLGQGPDRAARMEALTRDTPLRRFGTPEEVAAMVVFLASDESAYVTGAEFTIDGGLLAGSAAQPKAPSH